MTIKRNLHVSNSFELNGGQVCSPEFASHLTWTVVFRFRDSTKSHSYLISLFALQATENMRLPTEGTSALRARQPELNAKSSQITETFDLENGSHVFRVSWTLSEWRDLMMELDQSRAAGKSQFKCRHCGNIFQKHRLNLHRHNTCPHAGSPLKPFPTLIWKNPSKAMECLRMSPTERTVYSLFDPVAHPRQARLPSPAETSSRANIVPARKVNPPTHGGRGGKGGNTHADFQDTPPDSSTDSVSDSEEPEDPL